MKVKVIAFDWSGTISDDRKPVYSANMKLLDDYGIPKMSFEEWLPRTRMTPQEFLADCGINDDPDKVFRQYAEYFEEAKKLGIAPILDPNVKKTLEYLQEKNKSIVVISSHPKESLRREAMEYGIDNLISLIVGNSKGKVEELREVCRNFNLTPREIVYIGDTIYDMKAAREVGIFSVAVCNGYHTREKLELENPDIVIDKFGELIKFIE
jgi:HAD superfamily hydrolase (TIGR01549 family)